jgi:hypothetical protein
MMIGQGLVIPRIRTREEEAVLVVDLTRTT